jgi:hypothetical protein
MFCLFGHFIHMLPNAQPGIKCAILLPNADR